MAACVSKTRSADNLTVGLTFKAEGYVEIRREGDRLIVRPLRRGGCFRFSYDDAKRVALGLRREALSEGDRAAGADGHVWDVADTR